MSFAGASDASAVNPGMFISPLLRIFFQRSLAPQDALRIEGIGRERAGSLDFNASYPD
jgi:hypothetical protein